MAFSHNMIAFKMSCHSKKVSSAPVQYFIEIIRIKKYSWFYFKVVRGDN